MYTLRIGFIDGRLQTYNNVEKIMVMDSAAGGYKTIAVAELLAMPFPDNTKYEVFYDEGHASVIMNNRAFVELYKV